MRGIDVSHYQSVTDYNAAKNSIDFVFMKLTEGNKDAGSIDGRWLQHHNGFAGKLRGAYHFSDLSNIPAEVSYFKSQWQTVGWELDPMLDAEVSGINSAYIRAWIAEFRAQTGHQRIWVYSSKSLFQGACNPAGFADANTPLWAARYYSNNPTFSTLGWSHPLLEIYQYWNAGSVPGISGGVDMDVSNVNLGGAAPTPPPPTNGGFLMALTDQQQADLYNGVTQLVNQMMGGATGWPQLGNKSVVDFLGKTVGPQLADIHLQTVNAFPADLPVKNPQTDATTTYDAVNALVRVEVPALQAQVAGLASAVAALAQNPAINADQIKQIVEDAVVQHLNITGSVNIGPAA